MIKISSEIKYVHELLLLVAHELQILELEEITYKIVDEDANILYGRLSDFDGCGNRYKLGPLLSDKAIYIDEVIYIQNLGLNYEDYNQNFYESTNDHIAELLEMVFGRLKEKNILDQNSLFMYYDNCVDDLEIKKISFAINETVRILNSMDLYSKENMFENFLVCSEKTLTNISFQIFDFVSPLDPKTKIKINKFIKKM